MRRLVLIALSLGAVAFPSVAAANMPSPHFLCATRAEGDTCGYENLVGSCQWQSCKERFGGADCPDDQSGLKIRDDEFLDCADMVDEGGCSVSGSVSLTGAVLLLLLLWRTRTQPRS